MGWTSVHSDASCCNKKGSIRQWLETPHFNQDMGQWQNTATCYFLIDLNRILTGRHNHGRSLHMNRLPEFLRNLRARPRVKQCRGQQGRRRRPSRVRKQDGTTPRPFISVCLPSSLRSMPIVGHFPPLGAHFPRRRTAEHHRVENIPTAPRCGQ